jgi:hypothetical protein
MLVRWKHSATAPPTTLFTGVLDHITCPQSVKRWGRRQRVVHKASMIQGPLVYQRGTCGELQKVGALEAFCHRSPNHSLHRCTRPYNTPTKRVWSRLTQGTALCRYAQHQGKARANIREDTTRHVLQSWLRSTHSNNICCVPLPRVQHDGRHPRSFHTRAEPIERNLIHLFGTPVGVGGLN